MITCPKTDTDTVDITVYPQPIIDFTPIDTANCGPWTITFDNLSNAQNNEDTASMSFQWLVRWTSSCTN